MGAKRVLPDPEHLAAILARRRRTLFRILLALSTLIIVIWPISVRWNLMYGAENWTCGVINGRVYTLIGTRQYNSFLGGHSGFSILDADKLWGFALPGIDVDIAGNIPNTWLVCPFWVLLLILLGWALLLRRRYLAWLNSAGKCRQCGYNLTGNVSGICPECGCPVHVVGVHD